MVARRCGGEPIAYVDESPAEYQAFLESVGLPEPIARVMADSDVAVERGYLLVEAGDLGRLIGRPTTGLAETALPIGAEVAARTSTRSSRGRKVTS